MANQEGSEITVCVLASGSRGNAIYVAHGEHAILVDAGLSGREIIKRLTLRQLSPESIGAVLVSHEHSDHIRGAGVLSRRFHLPVYLAPKTFRASTDMLGKLHEIRHFRCGETFNFRKMAIHPFSTCHDAEDPVGFTINCNGKKIGIATDLGIATAMVKEHLKQCRALVLEANHDPQMLIDGPYPWPLKQRIKGRSGHLSNVDSRLLLHELQHDQLRHVVLAHLSEQNNTPQKAVAEVCQAITRCQPHLHVAQQDICGDIIRI